MERKVNKRKKRRIKKKSLNIDGMKTRKTTKPMKTNFHKYTVFN